MKIVSLTLRILLIWSISGCNYSEQPNNETNPPIIKLTGVIQNIYEPNGMNGYDIVQLRLIKSNVRQFFPSERYSRYNCIVDSPNAECYLILSSIWDRDGDTLDLDTENHSYILRHISGRQESGTFRTYDRDAFYRLAKRKSVIPQAFK